MLSVQVRPGSPSSTDPTIGFVSVSRRAPGFHGYSPDELQGSLLHLPNMCQRYFILHRRLRVPRMELLVIVLAGAGWTRLSMLFGKRRIRVDEPLEAWL